MTMIQRFEDIQAWQEARKLVKMIYALTNKDLFSKVSECVTKYEELQFLPWQILRKDLIANRRLNLPAFLGLQDALQLKFNQYFMLH